MNSTPSRIDAIDFVKGALVIAMVVYHAMNYVGYETLPRDHLGFLPTSFIMITGFLLMQVYACKMRNDSSAVRKRLIVRGLKLLAIFTVLNVAARLIWQRNHYGIELGLSEFLSSWFEVYVTSSSKAVAFDVLVPIAYTIWLAVPMIATTKRWRTAPMWFAGFVFAVCVVMDVKSEAINSLHFISAGLIGLWLGGRGVEEVDRAADSWVLVAVLCLGYLAIAMSGSLNYPAQIYMTVVALIVLYAIGRNLVLTDRFVAQVCLLGRYSLLSYIVQILLLQAARLIDRVGQLDQWVRAVVLSVFVSVLMWLLVAVIDVLRKRAPVIDWLYRRVFA